MPTLREVARIRSPFGDENSLESRAWLLWTAALREAKAKGQPEQREGRDGYRWVGVMAYHLRSLWPHVQKGSTEYADLQGSLYTFLRQTGNAICLRNTEPPVWWVAAEFSLDKKVVVITKSVSRAEARLTPQEAGEDREPAPVEVRRVEPKVARVEEEESVGRNAAVLTEEVESVEVSHRFKHVEQQMRDVLDISKTLPEPATVTELQAAYEIVTGERHTLRHIVDALARQGLMFSRVETADERALRAGGRMARATRARLWSTVNPVPKRTLVEVVEGVRLPSAHEQYLELVAQGKDVGIVPGGKGQGGRPPKKEPEVVHGGALGGLITGVVEAEVTHPQVEQTGDGESVLEQVRRLVAGEDQRTIESLRRDVAELTEYVKNQNAQIQEQSNAIRKLRAALKAATEA